MRKIEIQGESKEREDYLKQKMKQPEEDNNEEFNALNLFCFKMKERRDDPAASGILQPGAAFLPVPQASSVTSGKLLKTIPVQYPSAHPNVKYCYIANGPNSIFEMPCVQHISV